MEMASPTELSLRSPVSKDRETQKLEELVARLEEEKVKIDAFKRELPLCMQLLTNAMEASRQELQSKKTKQLSADKGKWMESVTLWNHQLEQQGSGENGNGGIELGLVPSSYFKGEEVCRSREGGCGGGGDKEKRKARRCWSPHLHSRFLHALHMLGGPQRQLSFVFWLVWMDAVATPKQITQLMRVDGLTCDEVKSHLQKYRLHTGIQGPNQVVVVGSIWVPPQYAAHGGAPPSPAAFYASTAGRLPLPPP